MKDLSIIVATINDSIATILSVQQALLACDDLDVEVLVIDNGSTLEDLQNLQNYYGRNQDSRIKFYQYPKKGAAPSHGYGAKLAQGKYLFFPDSHIFYDPHYFPQMIDFMDKYQDIGMLCSAYLSEGVGFYH